MTGRGKRTVRLAAILALVTAGSAVFALRGKILEEYEIWKLETGEEAEQHRAIVRLGELRAMSAAPRILAHVGRHSAGRAMDQEPPCVKLSIESLSGMGEPAVPRLLDALNDTERWVVFASACALGGMGPGARRAVPALSRKLSEGDRDTRIFAALALGLIGSDPVVALLAERIGEERDRELFTPLVAALCQTPGGQEIILQMLRDETAKVSREALVSALLSYVHDVVENARTRFALRLCELPPALVRQVEEARKRPKG